MTDHLEATRTANITISILARAEGRPGEAIEVRSKRWAIEIRDGEGLFVSPIRPDQGVHCMSRAKGKPGAFQWSSIPISKPSRIPISKPSRIPISKPSRIKEWRGAVEGGTSHPENRGDQANEEKESEGRDPDERPRSSSSREAFFVPFGSVNENISAR